jgi:transcriptional regulator with XRE-family HTH domain
MALSDTINLLKKERGLTNSQLSELSGVPLGTLDKITSGKTTDPKLDTVRALAKALGCTLDDFDDSNRNECDKITDLSKGNLTAKKELGKQIKFYRQKSKLTQQSLADLLNLKNKNILSSWELGKSEPDIFMIKKLCHIFKIDINTFFDFTDIKKLNVSNSDVLTDADIDLMKKIDALSDTDRKYLLKLVDALLDGSE